MKLRNLYLKRNDDQDFWGLGAFFIDEFSQTKGFVVRIQKDASLLDVASKLKQIGNDIESCHYKIENHNVREV